MKKTILAVCLTLLLVFSMGSMRSRYNPLNGEKIRDNTIDEDSIDWGTGTDQVSATDLPDFGTMTQTVGNVLASDGTDFESVAIVAYENAAVFYENEIVTY